MRVVVDQPGRATAPDRRLVARTPANVARVRELQRHAGNRATRRLLRQVVAPVKPQPTVTPGRDANEIVVELPDKSRYRVTRSVRARREIDPGRARLGLCHDDKRVFLRVAWCKGTKGRIDVGANPQGALGDLVGQIGKDVAAGKGVDDVINTVKDAKIEPFAEVDITRSEDWRVSGDVKLNVNRTGVLGVDAGVKFENGWITIRVSGQAGESGPGGSLTIEIPFDGPKPTHDPCPRQKVELLWQYTCDKEETRIEYVPQKPIPHLDDGTAVLYFDYETADFATKGMTGAANQEQHGKLRDFFGEGYVVTDIKGWTSPEGKRELPSGTTAGRFPGNDPLSKQRADKARDVAVGYCQMRTSQCATEATPATGMGEKLGLEADVGGTRLEQAVVQQFTSDAAELDRLPADERAFITDQRQSVHARAARIYPWLRRAEIKLLHSWSEPVPDKPVPKTGFERIEACPVEVENAADEHWGSRIPFTTPEPSICKQR